MAINNIQIETSQLAESREVKSSQFWHNASGSEAAFNVLTVTGEYLVDGKVLAKEISVSGTLNVRGEVEVL
ncbi:MAG: hypothetical protein DRP29_00520 [Thermodesulfobacteriota bacterium]|nr:MAG: hypothetical protein DRP29_00520 [Thermodesulfobacteriota bacterium]